MTGRTAPSYAHGLELSRQAKQRRKQPCVRGCGRLTSWDSTTGVCDRCRRADHPARCGTNSMYSLGCRCDECRAAHAAYQRDYYRRKRTRLSVAREKEDT